MIKHLYIHVPFCNAICFYCDFSRRIYKEDIVDKWLEIIEKEINDKCKDEYETIYIGGGTPTSLNEKQLEKLLSLIEKYSHKTIEYTIEINPESLNENKVKLFKKYHLNRFSIGLQSTNNQLLKDIGRRHNYEDYLNTIELLKKHDLDNISVDLMYALPNQNIEILNQSIDDILNTNIKHISIYSLILEDNSIFNKKGIKNIDIDLEADMYELIINKLNKNGYKQYEVSNFSLINYESKHNIGYWLYDDFLGISLGASSKINHQRYTNTSSFDKYFNDYNIKDEIINLNKEDEIFENIMMSLRMNKGINIKEFNEKYNIDLLEKYNDTIKNNDNLIIKDGYLSCLSLSILNHTLLDFME